DDFNKLRAVANAGASDDIARVVPKIQAALANPSPIYVSGTLVTPMTAYQQPGGGWTFAPSRRTCAIQNVKGEITSLTLAWQYKVTTVRYAADQQISVPPGWGRCKVRVDGSAGTTFTFAEAN